VGLSQILEPALGSRACVLKVRLCATTALVECLSKWAGHAQVFQEFQRKACQMRTGMLSCLTIGRCLQVVMLGRAAQAGAAMRCAGGCAQLACAARAALLMPGVAAPVL